MKYLTHKSFTVTSTGSIPDEHWDYAFLTDEQYEAKYGYTKDGWLVNPDGN